MSSETTPEGVALLPMTSAPDSERERSYSYGSSSSPVVTLGPGDLQRAVLPAESDGKEEDSSCSDVTVRVLSTAVVTIVINMIQAVSFGNLLLPRTPRLDAARPIAITSYLLSVSTAQYAASWRSGLPFLSGGAAYELLPLLLAMGNGLVGAVPHPLPSSFVFFTHPHPHTHSLFLPHTNTHNPTHRCPRRRPG